MLLLALTLLCRTLIAADNATTEVSGDSSGSNESSKNSLENVLIAVGVTVGVILVIIAVAVVLCVVFRKRISACLGSKEEDSHQAPAALYYTSKNFNHRGALKIQKNVPVEVGTVFADDKDTNPTNARFQFTDNENEVFDIGSEVEQVVE